jgi:LPXTG-site transpeptidase (sortase) family protein
LFVSSRWGSMKSKIIFRRTLLIAGLTGFAFSPSLPFDFIRQSSAPLIENAVALPKQERTNLPVRLKIPKINVDAAFEYVGLDPLGAMDIPKGPANVAWFNLGPRPGENGSAVIAGHYGRWKNGEGSVFDNLNKLGKGDRVYVEDENGAIISFVVRESRKYDPEADASDVFGSNDGKSHLNLITCEGVWNETEKSYSSRLVVFADKE